MTVRGVELPVESIDSSKKTSTRPAMRSVTWTSETRDSETLPRDALAHLVANNPIDRRHRRHIILSADPVIYQFLPDLPCEHRRIRSLIAGNALDDSRSRHFRLGSSDDAGTDWTSGVVPPEDFGDTAVRDSDKKVTDNSKDSAFRSLLKIAKLQDIVTRSIFDISWCFKNQSIGNLKGYILSVHHFLIAIEPRELQGK